MPQDVSAGGAQGPRARRTDEELVAAAAQGDDRAFHDLVDRHADRLFRLAFRLVSNSADAEDVVQETLMGAFRHLGRFRGRSTVRTWLSGILVRQAARCLRRRGRRRAAALPESEGLADRARDVAADTGRRLDIGGALRELSPEHREVVVLREYEGMSYAEIAEALAVPRGTVESRLFRARQQLKVILRGYLPQERR